MLRRRAFVLLVLGCLAVAARAEEAPGPLPAGEPLPPGRPAGTGAPRPAPEVVPGPALLSALPPPPLPGVPAGPRPRVTNGFDPARGYVVYPACRDEAPGYNPVAELWGNYAGCRRCRPFRRAGCRAGCE